jgi:hypothetical protein
MPAKDKKMESSDTVERECAYEKCKKMFIPETANPSQKYCSDVCWKRANGL